MNSVNKFLEKVASKTPTPGGGSVSAVSGAMAASLVEMVCNLTIGKKGYEKVQSKIRTIKSQSNKLRKELLKLADEDAKAYESVVSAFKVSKNNPKRKQKIQTAFKKAVLIPLETAKKSGEVLDLAEKALEIGNKNTSSDARVAIFLSKTAIKGALENVEINRPSITDERFKKEIKPAILLLSRKARE